MCTWIFGLFDEFHRGELYKHVFRNVTFFLRNLFECSGSHTGPRQKSTVLFKCVFGWCLVRLYIISYESHPFVDLFYLPIFPLPCWSFPNDWQGLFTKVKGINSSALYVCIVLKHQCLKSCLAYRRCSIIICWNMKKWMKRSVLFSNRKNLSFPLSFF